jgi:hypothetical protein
MSAKFASRVATAVVALALTLGLVLTPSRAFAAGSFKLKTSSVNEVSGAWHIFVTVELPRPPATAHVPMKFLFTKEAVFERALVDGHEGPVTNRMVLQNQTPQVESLDVDFADGSGKIFKGTRFDFGLARDRGYEAGEYRVQVRTADGVELSGNARLTLNGENPVVDRRSITFNAKDKGVKKVPGYGDDGGAANGPPKADTDETPVQSSEVAPTGSASPFIPSDAYNKTPEEEIKTRPSGCGCVVAGASGTESAALGLGGLALGLVAIGARRRASRRR